jgi:hypothetical protein
LRSANGCQISSFFMERFELGVEVGLEKKNSAETKKEVKRN